MKTVKIKNGLRNGRIEAVGGLQDGYSRAFMLFPARVRGASPPRFWLSSDLAGILFPQAVQ